MATATPKKAEELDPVEAVESESAAEPVDSPESSESPESSKTKDASPPEPEKVEKAEKPATVIDVAQELNKIQEELKSVSPKNTTRLVTLENNLNRYRKLIAESDAELTALAEGLKTDLQAKFVVNGEHQLTLKTQTEELVVQLESALEEGKSLSALPTWDKIQGNISNTNGEIRQGLQTLTQKFKAKIVELRDWKIFAATEKKKDLIQQMEKLKDSNSQPGEKSKLISKLHKEWKELGRSNQNDELWEQFKKVSDLAYEPCKQYFKERKQLMAANLKARRDLCDKLEAQLKTFEENPPANNELSKQLRDAEEQWKKHAPVEQSRIKQLQKRYYAVVNQLRKMRKDGLKGSAKRKAEIIEQASALLQLEDRAQAMAKAKTLQQEWKSAGQSSYKEDKQYWEKFRSICDEIFSQKEKNRAEIKAKVDQAQQQLNELLNSLEAMLKLEDEELRAEKSTYQNLQQSFATALDDFRSKSKSKFRDKFNNIKRRLDTRLKSLPDKKSQALLQMLQKCLDYLRPLESKMLSSKAEEFEQAKQQFSDDQWQELTQAANSEFVELLNRRVELLREAEDSKAYLAASESASEQLRELCIEAEIRAGSDTPTDDQPKRMELQLTQLKQGFGKRQPDRESNIQYVRDSRMKCLCLGPLAEKDQQVFSSRLEKSLQRLL